MTILFTYPGQGAQREGMLHELPSDPVVRQTIIEANDTLGRDVLALDTKASLRSSVAVQVGLLVAGVAMSRYLMVVAGPPDGVAGLSVGAYPAAVIAGALPFTDALRLVERRARLMEAAYPSGHGMTAILGLEVSALAPLVAQVNAPESPVYLANINAPTQLVIAGASAAMARVGELARNHGAHGVKLVAIRVPSHCALLEAPAAALARDVAAVPMTAPRLHFFSASLVRELRDAARVADDLACNMARQVLWHDTTTLAHENGVRLSIEMPPGQVLTRLGTAAFTDAVFVAASDTRIDTLAVLMERERRREI